MTRRDALRLGAVGVVAGCSDNGALTDTGFSEEPAPEPWEPEGSVDDAAFPLGVQLGDPRSDSANCWTRFEGDGDVTLVVAQWDGLGCQHFPHGIELGTQIHRCRISISFVVRIELLPECLFRGIPSSDYVGRCKFRQNRSKGIRETQSRTCGLSGRIGQFLRHRKIRPEHYSVRIEYQ